MREESNINTDLKIPFDEKGNMLGYRESWALMKDNIVFEDSFKYKTFTRGRSSVKFIFVNSAGNNYEMFASDLDKLIKTKDLSNVLFGKWAIVKQGANYGLVMIKQ